MPAPVHLQLAQQIVDTLKSICEHDINYIDIHGRICASTDSSRVEEYHEGGHEAARTGEIVRVDLDDPERGVRKGINMPIKHHGETVAVIGITGEPEEVQKYAFLAQRITRLLLREHDMDLRDRNNRTRTSYLIRCLTQNEPIHPDFVKEVLQANGVAGMRGVWRTVVFLLNRTDKMTELLAIETDLFQSFEQLGHALYTYFYPGEYVLIVESEQLEKKKYLLRNLADRYRGLLRIGVGSGRKLTAQYLSYNGARLGISGMQAGKNLVYFEELDLELLLAGVSERVAEAYLQKCLTGLDPGDLELLTVYFAHERSLKETAEALYLHKNTLQYRLNRIRDRCGYDPRSFRDAVVLYTAIKLNGMQQENQASQPEADTE